MMKRIVSVLVLAAILASLSLTAFAVTAPLKVTSVKPSATSAVVGDRVTFAVATTGGAAGKLTYAYYVFKDGVKFATTGYGASSNFTYQFPSAGSYKVAAFAKDSAGKAAFATSVAVTVAAANYGSLTIKSIVPATDDGAEVYDTTTFAVTALGGKLPYTYAFYVYKDGVAVTKTTYGTSNKFSYTYPTSGNYRITAFVKDAAGKKVTAVTETYYVSALVEDALTFDSMPITYGAAKKVLDTATFTANVYGGSPAYTYAFYVQKNGETIYRGAYGTSNQFAYTFPTAGAYNLLVFVKDSVGKLVKGSSATYEITAPAPVVVKKLAITNVSIDNLPSNAGQTATFTTTAEGGVARYTYAFYVYKNGATIYKSTYTKSATFSYTFAKGGTYNVSCFVKDAKGNVIWRFATDAPFVVSEKTTPIVPVKAVSVSIDIIPVSIGQSGLFTVTAKDGTKPYTYAFYVVKDGATIKKTGYGSSDSFYYTFNAAGDYKVIGFVKDAKGNTDYTNSITFSID